MANNIISTMIVQHRQLQKQITQAIELSKQDKSKAQEILTILQQFKKNLIEHLKLENETFYVQLLQKMKDIEKTVAGFLGKYNNTEAISNSFAEFAQQVAQVAQALTLRIESEESGVYSY